MRIHAQEVLKKHIVFYLFVALSLISLITTIVNLKAIQTFKKPYLIAIDSNGTRVISDSSDPIYKTEATAFIQKFILSIYNFNPDNFMQKLGPATAMMSESLWKQKKSEILSLKAKVESEEITLSGQISKITKDDNKYFVLVDSVEKSRLNQLSHKIKVTISLINVPRTNENPYGIEVEEYDETILP